MKYILSIRIYVIKTDYKSSVSSKIHAGKQNVRSMPLALIRMEDRYACVQVAEMAIQPYVDLMVLRMLVNATYNRQHVL